MRKLLIAIIIIFSYSFAYSNEVQIKNHIAEVKNKKVAQNIKMMHCGSILLGYSTFSFISVSVLMYPTIKFSHFTTSFMLGCLSFAAVGLLIPGIVMFCIGNKKYNERKLSTNILPILKKNEKLFKNLAIISGIINSIGLVLGGTGISMICLGKNYNNDNLYCWGFTPGIPGCIAFLGSLPLMITSLAMYGWCRGEINRLGVDFAVVPDDSRSNKQTLPDWKNCKLSLACNVRF